MIKNLKYNLKSKNKTSLSNLMLISDKIKKKLVSITR